MNKRTAGDDVDLVLLVEDDPAIADIATMVLEDAGYEVLGAIDVTQAKAWAVSRPDISVVLTDVNFRTGPDGLSMARELRSDGLAASIVIMSGDQSWANHVSGDIKFLAKPFGTAELLDAVADACTLHRKS